MARILRTHSIELILKAAQQIIYDMVLVFAFQPLFRPFPSKKMHLLSLVVYRRSCTTKTFSAFSKSTISICCINHCDSVSVCVVRIYIKKYRTKCTNKIRRYSSMCFTSQAFGLHFRRPKRAYRFFEAFPCLCYTANGYEV